MSRTKSSPDSDPELVRSRLECRRVATSHYENFLVASVLLPREFRQPFFDLYAFCRTADDFADESENSAIALNQIEFYRDQIRRLFRSDPVSGIIVALADTVQRFNLPQQPFEDLLDAFVQDQSVTRYADESQLHDYCRRSADPVGRLVLAMAGCDDDENVRLSDQICTGLQLANFWQDVARDFHIGRIYLPHSVMRRFEFDDEEIRRALQERRPTPANVRRAIADQCGAARQRFDAGLPLIDRVPRWLAADIDLFICGGLATLDAIERIDFDVLRQRVQVSKWRQAAWVGRLILSRSFHRIPRAAVT